ncbi:MAG: TetR/AcrR family transcriptional regulator [Acidimicrobiales bacterium]
MPTSPVATTPPVRRASALPADERRSMIVRAALPLLLHSGEMVTTRQIADAAGIAEGTIFRVFPDKDAVIAAVLDAALDVAPLERAISRIDPCLDLPDALEAAIIVMQQRVVDIWRLFSSLGPRAHHHRPGPPADLDALVALFEVHRSELAVTPVAAARLLRALTLAGTHPMLAGTPMRPAEIVGVFLHGVNALAADRTEGGCPAC